MGSNNTQVAIFYVHGTINTPNSNTPEYRAATAAAYQNVYGNNNVTTDNTFNWSDRSGLTNQNTGRGEAAAELTTHVENYVRTGLANGSIDPNKPLKIVLNGFSHGGNVALQAADDIAAIQQRYGIKNMSIDVNGYNTPEYYNNAGNTLARNNNPEDPAVVNTRVRQNSGGNVKFNHNAFSTRGDGVGGSTGLAVGGTYPRNGVTRRVVLDAPNTNRANGVAVHGAVISDPHTRRQAASSLLGTLTQQKAREDRSQRQIAPSIGPR
jgi:hypothetical protein